MKSPKIKAFLTWMRRHLATVIILGMFIFCIVVLMTHGEGFFQAVQSAYMLVSYFQSNRSGDNSGDSGGAIPIPLLIIILVALIGFVVYLWKKDGSRK